MGVVALLCLVLLMVLAVALATPLKNDTACYGTLSAGPCSIHELTCDTGKVFIVQAVLGVKPNNSACAVRPPICRSDPGSCCQPEVGDCMEAYSTSHFQQLYNRCWNKTSCSYRVPQHNSQTCGRGFHIFSGYSQIDYVCLTGSSITNFDQTTPVRGSVVAVAYSYSYTDQDRRLSCRVDSASCSRVSTNVLLYKKYNAPRFSTLYLNGAQYFTCSGFSNFTAVRNVSTPFNISLEIVRPALVSETWVVVQGSDTDELSLTCGYPGDTADTALCPGTTETSSASSVTSLTSTSTSTTTSTSTSTTSTTSSPTTSNPSNTLSTNSITASTPPSTTLTNTTPFAIPASTSTSTIPSTTPQAIFNATSTSSTLSLTSNIPNTTFSTTLSITSSTSSTSSITASSKSSSSRTSNAISTIAPASTSTSGASTLLSESCPQLTESSPYGSFTWPETREGSTARRPCPNGPVTPGFNATRQCSRLLLEVSWRPSRLHGCNLTTEARHELLDIALQPVNASNALIVSRDLVNVTKDAATFSQDDVSLAVHITLSLLQQPQVVESREQVVSMVTALDGLLGTPKEEVTSETGAKLLEAISLVGREASLSGGKLQTVQPRLALVAVPLPPSQSFPGLQLAASTPPNSSLDASKVWLSNSTSSSEATGREETSISLPSDLLKSLPAETNVTRITFAVFQNADLFTAIGEDSREGGSNDTRFISSPVVAAAVPGLHLQNLSSPVLISLPHHKLGVDAQCVFWQETLSGGHWSSQGCEVRETGDWRTLCACTHLTNFALLMDVHQTGGQLSQADMRALSIISMVGCVLSLLGLLLTLLTFCLFRSLRKDNPPKIHMNLCVALALSNIIFVAGLQDYTFGNIIACKAVAALLHLCLLSAMTWTSVEAFYLYLALVRVFNTYTHRFLLKCTLVAWGVPFLIVVLTLGINKTNNYGLQDSGVCWLGGAAFYGAFAGPVLLLLLCNFLGFGLALHRMLTHTSTTRGRGATSGDHISLARQLRGAVGVLVLLGLTWIFAIFAIGGASVVFHYLFAIFNSLQGLFIFIFYCLLKKDARAQWQHLLSCSCTRTIQYRISHSGFSTRLRRLTLQGTALTSTGEDNNNKSADGDADANADARV